MPHSYQVGDQLEPLSIVVDEPSMKVFTLIMRDPNGIHFDPDATEALGMGRNLVNQGTLNMAYPINLLLGMVDDPSQLKNFRCRFTGSLYGGDTVTVGGEVTAVDGNEVTVSIWVDRDAGGRAISGSAVLAL